MLVRSTLQRYHVFLLDTAARRPRRLPFMTNHPSRFVIAAVDDDQSMLESLKKLLESADYSVRLFSSAAALLESGEVAEIHCLISDVVMPAMDGFELSRTVHAARPKLPIILISGQAGVLNGSRPAGGAHYRLFEKPFDADELLLAIGNALRERHASELPL